MDTLIFVVIIYFVSLYMFLGGIQVASFLIGIPVKFSFHLLVLFYPLLFGVFWPIYFIPSIKRKITTYMVDFHWNNHPWIKYVRQNGYIIQDNMTGRIIIGFSNKKEIVLLIEKENEKSKWLILEQETANKLWNWLTGKT